MDPEVYRSGMDPKVLCCESSLYVWYCHKEPCWRWHLLAKCQL